jgi:hypothetical protein
MFVPV